MRKVTVLVALIILSQASFSYALNPDTHKAINEYIANNSLNGFSLDTYLKSNLGMQAGKTEKFGTNTVWERLRDGGEYEDKPPEWYSIPYRRSVNHFHNPLTDAGYSGFWGTGIMSGMSSTQWALQPQSTQSPGGYYSWYDTRNYYLKALTSTSKTDRDINFAETFRGIGQLMHLVEDASVPAHTRNDGHAAYNYETWVATPNNVNISAISPIFFSGVINNIASFIDTNTYKSDSSNPEDTASNTVGLAEYTNANFFSEDTINAAKFPYPRITSETPVVAKDYYSTFWKTTYPRQYYLKKCCGETNSPNGYLLAAVDYLDYWRQQHPLLSLGLSIKPVLDSNVYKDYASLLLPRAVGYSAGLLNYFFRGDIDLQEDTTTGYVIVNNTEEDMQGTFDIYYDKKSHDDAGNKIIVRTLLWSSTSISESGLFLDKKSSGNNKSTNVSFDYPTEAAEPGKYILVFSGRLGKENNAIVGKVVNFPDLYILVIPVNHETREMEEKKYFGIRVTDSSSGSAALTETTAFPFTLLDDGAYWDSTYRTWTKKTDSESLGVPLGVGGPQYIAKYWDEENQRIRFVPNLSYEKEAYTAFNLTPSDSYGQIKDINYVNYIGSPLFGFGMYNENTGWMEYTDKGLYAILSPAGDPKQRLFSLYKGNNFNDTFVEAPYLKLYDFNGADLTASIPKDPEAPYSSIAGAYKPAGESYVKVSIPKVYNTYIKPNPVWKNGMSTASSGVEYYRLYPNIEATYETEGQKCSSEDNNCGNAGTNGSTVKTVFDIPYNFNSYIRVHRNDEGEYYEEIYINGQLAQSSTPSAKLETHYQILAIYKDTAIVRETNYVSTEEIPLDYRLESNRIYERHWNFTSKYYIYINGKRYDLQGATNTTTKHLNVPHFETASGVPRVDYLTYEPVDDIAGYHLDRIFISDTFDGSYVLVAFDEYAYNNGSGLTHDLKYEPSDSDATKHILYYDIPKTEIQNADHEAIRTGRKLLLFKADGTFKQELQDPIGLDKTIGSIGILN